jgi:hypothetical protein
MMNGRRKSDRPVVATKPANKAGVTANDASALVAERVERRGLAKGKPLGQNTNRALDREVVQSALSRIRQAAVKDKQAKFTSLMHHIYNLSMLREAYFALKRDAAPGVDGETWRMLGVSDLAGYQRALPERNVNCGLPLSPTGSASRFKFISGLNTQPALSPVNASTAFLRAPPHDSGSLWLARPLTFETFIQHNLPVYPGAQE